MVDPNRILLGVNVDHVATLRQARGTRYPDPVKAALDAEQAGADGITVHLREDARRLGRAGRSAPGSSGIRGPALPEGFGAGREYHRDFHGGQWTRALCLCA